jgi:ABC-type Fe3+/spermidine/putrescine transport system ATPase subunit
MVFQNYAVFPHMTVFENVAFGLKSRKIKSSEIKKRVARVLELARLSGYEERTPDQLSGGQQQRVGLARAMVIEPQVLLMDEPLSNLDAKLRVEMREEIRDIQKQLGITTIYVTHDQEEALVISDRIAVMNAGVIQQVGASWEIYKEPANTFVASFVGNMNFMEGEIVASNADGVEVAVEQHTVKAPTPGVSVKAVRMAVRPEDLSVDSDRGSEEGFSSIPGTIKKSTYTGSLIRYTVDCGADLDLMVERYKPEYEALILPNGSSVFVKIPVNALLLFHLDTGERL